MRKILDKMFGYKKLAFWIPVILAALLYLLLVLFGSEVDKREFLVMTPVITVIWFFGSFLVVFAQVKNPRCPEWFLNLMELMSVVIFTAFSVIGAVSYIMNGFQSFTPAICMGLITYSSVSLAHSKRSK